MVSVSMTGRGADDKDYYLRNTLGLWHLKNEIPERKSLQHLCFDIFSRGLLNHHERRAAASVPSVVIVSQMFFFE